MKETATKKNHFLKDLKVVTIITTFENWKSQTKVVIMVTTFETFSKLPKVVTIITTFFCQ